MRTIFSCFIICLIISLFSCSQNKTDKNGGQTNSGKVSRNNVQREQRKTIFHTITSSSYEADNRAGNIQEGTYRGKTVSTYDDYGKISETKYYTPKNELLYKESNEYDSTGRLKATNRSLATGTRGIKIIPTYNDRGIRDEDTWYNPSGTLYCTIKMKYNESGKIKESKTYDAQGKLIQSISSYTYNDSGDVKECVYHKPDGSVNYTLSYEYKDIDDIGNWRTNIVSKNNIPEQIIKREIEYLTTFTY